MKQDVLKVETMLTSMKEIYVHVANPNILYQTSHMRFLD